MNKVLYFGSFNPVHYGHTGIARYVAAMPEVDAVVIIPSPHNPFKDTASLADPKVRLEQVHKRDRAGHQPDPAHRRRQHRKHPAMVQRIGDIGRIRSMGLSPPWIRRRKRLPRNLRHAGCARRPIPS